VYAALRASSRRSDIGGGARRPLPLPESAR
jgi:hypothetical protein